MPRNNQWLSLSTRLASLCRHLKKRPCEEEMSLFSECLTKGEACSEFEEKYFECVQSAE